MCGIVGAISKDNILETLLEGLRRLEYRGYDSAGVALLNDGTLKTCRVVGKVAALSAELVTHPINGHIGISHTRWATHGRPNQQNAHPHCSHQRIALVHNGIIENHELLRERLKGQGYVFTSETDTESAVHLLHFHLSQNKTMLEALQALQHELIGAYALAIIDQQHPDRLWGIRKGSPLVIGIGENGHYLASDVLALAPQVKRFIYLEEGDIAELRVDAVDIYQHQNKVQRNIHEIDNCVDSASKGKYQHFMQQEIFAQPAAITQILKQNGLTDQLTDQLSPELFGRHAGALFQQVQRIQVVACGTSYHAGLVSRYWLEQIAGVPCTVDIASEYRYRQAVVSPGTLLLLLSQSGETADTLAALQQANNQGYLATLGICNVPMSSLARLADMVFFTHAGIEVGVAATKTFTNQLVALLLLTLVFAGMRQPEKAAALVSVLHKLPELIEQTLQLEPQIKLLAQSLVEKQHALFLGRGVMFPIALEGALKMKEISYIHAEAYPAGELKHGPLALVDAAMSVIALAPNNILLDKLLSNLEEVQARGGDLIVLADQSITWKSATGQVLPMPSVPDVLAPMVYTVPLQLLAYHIGVLRGADVDQPRNLAKSVTVE